jgi:hypothetical protein
MRSLPRFWTIPLICAATALVACDSDREPMAPSGSPSTGGGLQADLGGTLTGTATEWLERAKLFGAPLSDDAAATSFAPEPEDDPHNAVPFQFDPFKTGLVRSTWLRGVGCPTNANFTPFGGSSTPFEDTGCPTGDDKDNKFDGLLLVKTGPTANFASAGVDMKNVKGIILTELGYDIRSGSHCGAGAPRFNVVTIDGVTHFVGCNSPPPVITAASTGWQRRRWTPAQAFPPIVEPVESITLMLDEGQDAGGAPDFSGHAIVDNIDINGSLTGRGPGN